MTKQFFLTFFLISLMGATTVWAKGDPVAGKAKSEVCVACHNADGNSTVPAWPKIAGQQFQYLVDQLMEYRKGPEGNRANDVMYGIVSGFSDQDIFDLAAYFSAQTQTPGKADDALLALGEKTYRGGNIETHVSACIACHGPKGRGNELAKYPRLAGQHAEYTKTQLQAFASGARKNDPSGMMRSISEQLSEEEIRAVSSYIEGLQ